ncbi:glycosyltransferase [Paenibacillus sp. p3-SID867]|uniref:glycosyltransferase n=1 Tax=Paenibacillus sp. p3-SID867 TaxID=2916363 RepID=UPI0021A7CBC1|nr:glycosyltransferase [Paenibacillus sp. p3-SID867]MCT1403456.1 glycosyltransferase [Paenibacillus sp. p3-SID867]
MPKKSLADGEKKMIKHQKNIAILLNRKIIRRSIDTLIWLADNILSEKQKEFVKRKLSLRTKNLLKGAIMGERYNALLKVSQIKHKMLNLGFEEKAYTELSKLATNTEDNTPIQREAMWELALWHADKKNREDARIGLQYLSELLVDEKNKVKIRQGTILKLELLNVLGQKEQAKRIVNDLEKEAFPDLFLAAANLEYSVETKRSWINKMISDFGLGEIGILDDDSKSVYDQLTTLPINSHIALDVTKRPKVSVIMPVFNSESVLGTAIRSILEQTWKNIELIVIDDCSSDGTREIVQQFASRDNRITLLSTKSNSGTYVARNIGLETATGEYITCHDADDWSHAEKLEKQVLHLIENPKVIGNMSQQCRLTEDLFFYRRKQQRFYIFNNMSSLMFRRKEVLEKIGLWDSVRFGADGEFIRRVRKVFGDKSIVPLNTGPLSFPRVSPSSLTESGPFGYHGFFFGARQEYVESFTYHHNNATCLKYSNFLEQPRPFPVPEPMRPDRNGLGGYRKFDVIIVSDFRLAGGTTSSNVEEIKAQREVGLKTGLIQLSSYAASGVQGVHPKIRQLIDGDNVQMIVYGEKVTCDVMIVRHPPILQEKQKYVPEVKAKGICVIVNQTPKVDYSGKGDIAYDIKQCQKNLREYFGADGIWYPISPLIRKALNEHHSNELSAIQLASEDWHNIINISLWKRPGHIRTDKMRIGRHSRDQYVKWPADREQLLQIYPDSDPFEVHILGGAKVPEKTLGKLPNNWRVLEFGEKDPKEFLENIDVFVYYVHPDCIEAFGRVIIEAMAVGVPVILPLEYSLLFEDAAIYAEPHEVRWKINSLLKDEREYELQVHKALEFLGNKLDYSCHIERVQR